MALDDVTQLLPAVEPVSQSVPPKSEQYADFLLNRYAGLQNDPHGAETPRRFLEMLSELTAHRDCDMGCVKWKAFENEGMDEMIVVGDIPFVSVCNHHVIPFIGVAHIAYVPGMLIAGLSKFARVVDHFARTLQVQERLTANIGDFLKQSLDPRGVAVVLKAEHMCMTIRGVQKPGARTTTAYMDGVFGDHNRTAKAEFLRHINGR